MSENTNNGGPAFPVSTAMGEGGYGHQDGNSTWQFPGMTLRDYFAGKAITGCLPGSRVDPDEHARWAYRMADAMLAARGVQ